MRSGTGGHGARGRYQSYCNACHAEYNRERRRGKTGVLVRTEDRGLVLAIQRAELTAEERDAVIDTIVEMRAQPAGRHHAGLSVADRDFWWRRMLVPCVMNVALCSLVLWVPFVAWAVR